MSLVCVAIVVLSLLEQIAASCYNKNELTNQTYSTWTSSLSSTFGQPKEQDNNYYKSLSNKFLQFGSSHLKFDA